MIATSTQSAVRADRVAALAGPIGTRITAELVAALGRIELTETGGVLVLSALARRGPLRPREIQEITMLSSGGTTNQLDRLAGLGLVTRSHDLVEGDRRAVLVALAPRGREVVDLVAATLARHVEAIRTFLGELDAELGGGAPGPSHLPALRGEPTVGGATASEGAGAGLADPRLVDGLIVFTRLGVALRAAMVTGFEDAAVFGNETAVILGMLLSGGPRRPRDLQPLVALSSGGLAKLLARLEAAGLVTLDRHRLDADRRATIVSITARGRRAMAVAGAALAERRDEIRAITRELAELLDA
jgi:DNA-binding MarR family transcriptional regulator